MDVPEKAAEAVSVIEPSITYDSYPRACGEQAPKRVRRLPRIALAVSLRCVYLDETNPVAGSEFQRVAVYYARDSRRWWRRLLLGGGLGFLRILFGGRGVGHVLTLVRLVSWLSLVRGWREDSDKDERCEERRDDQPRLAEEGAAIPETAQAGWSIAGRGRYPTRHFRKNPLDFVPPPTRYDSWHRSSSPVDGPRNRSRPLSERSSETATASGERRRARAKRAGPRRDGDGLCLVHNASQDMRELGRLGGRATPKAKRVDARRETLREFLRREIDPARVWAAIEAGLERGNDRDRLAASKLLLEPAAERQREEEAEAARARERVLFRMEEISRRVLAGLGQRRRSGGGAARPQAEVLAFARFTARLR